MGKLADAVSETPFENLGRLAAVTGVPINLLFGIDQGRYFPDPEIISHLRYYLDRHFALEELLPNEENRLARAIQTIGRVKCPPDRNLISCALGDVQVGDLIPTRIDGRNDWVEVVGTDQFGSGSASRTRITVPARDGSISTGIYRSDRIMRVARLLSNITEED